jgi:hypothetical protein
VRQMAQRGQAGDTGGGRMPSAVRLALAAGIALLLAGALYLIFARREALLAALWGLASLCF